MDASSLRNRVVVWLQTIIIVRFCLGAENNVVLLVSINRQFVQVTFNLTVLFNGKQRDIYYVYYEQKWTQYTAL